MKISKVNSHLFSVVGYFAHKKKVSCFAPIYDKKQALTLHNNIFISIAISDWFMGLSQSMRLSDISNKSKKKCLKTKIN